MQNCSSFHHRFWVLGWRLSSSVSSTGTEDSLGPGVAESTSSSQPRFAHAAACLLTRSLLAIATSHHQLHQLRKPGSVHAPQYDLVQTWNLLQEHPVERVRILWEFYENLLLLSYPLRSSKTPTYLRLKLCRHLALAKMQYQVRTESGNHQLGGTGAAKRQNESTAQLRKMLAPSTSHWITPNIVGQTAKRPNCRAWGHPSFFEGWDWPWGSWKLLSSNICLCLSKTLIQVLRAGLDPALVLASILCPKPCSWHNCRPLPALKNHYCVYV